MRILWIPPYLLGKSGALLGTFCFFCGYFDFIDVLNFGRAETVDMDIWKFWIVDKFEQFYDIFGQVCSTLDFRHITSDLVKFGRRWGEGHKTNICLRPW